MINCPLKLDVGCQYGVNLKCPSSDYEECPHYQLHERNRIINEMTRIQIEAEGLEQSLISQELDLWKDIRSRDV
jgi:hypothetical protein